MWLNLHLKCVDLPFVMHAFIFLKFLDLKCKIFMFWYRSDMIQIMRKKYRYIKFLLFVIIILDEMVHNNIIFLELFLFVNFLILMKKERYFMRCQMFWFDRVVLKNNLSVSKNHIDYLPHITITFRYIEKINVQF